jgi:hypothetical protein
MGDFKIFKIVGEPYFRLKLASQIKFFRETVPLRDKCRTCQRISKSTSFLTERKSSRKNLPDALAGHSILFEKILFIEHLLKCVLVCNTADRQSFSFFFYYCKRAYCKITKLMWSMLPDILRILYLSRDPSAAPSNLCWMSL